MKIRVDVAGKGGEGRLSILTLPGEQVLKKKIEDLKIQLKPAKVRELTVLQNKKAIQSLRADVVKLDALKNLRTTLADRTRRIAVAMPGGGITKAGRVWIVEGSGRSFTTITGSDGTDISILFHLDPGENSGALYERITARVKQALPENLTLEPKFDAKAGAVTLRLSGSGTKGATTEFIGKLIDAIKSELNAGK
jgi:hypothetical protein